MGLGDFLGDLAGAALPIAGGAIGTAIGGPLGGKIGAGLGSAAAGAIGGDDQPGAGTQQGAGYSTGVPLDYYAAYGAAAAQAQLPLTLAATRYGGANTANIGAQSLLAQGLGAGSMASLQDAATRGRAVTALQSEEVRQLLNKGLGLKESLGQARLGVGLLNPQFLAQSAAAARSGENELAISQGKTNQGLKALQEAAKTNIAQQFAKDLGTIAQTRALTQGNLATGAQRISGQLALADQNIMGNLTLNKAKTMSDLARIDANTDATKELRANAVNIALAGQRYFG